MDRSVGRWVLPERQNRARERTRCVSNEIAEPTIDEFIPSELHNAPRRTNRIVSGIRVTGDQQGPMTDIGGSLFFQPRTILQTT